MNYLNTSSPTPLELFMEHQFGLDRVRISHPFDAVDRNPDLSITRNDDRHGPQTFNCPRVDVVYNRKRYFGYVQIETKVQTHKGWFITEHTHVIDEDKLVANLEIMLQDIIDGVIYD